MNKPSSLKADAAVVEFLIPIPSLTFVTTNRVQLAQITDWLDMARGTQLPANKMGAVGPWCKITLLTLESASGKQMTTTSIYKSDGITDLLAVNQRQDLLNVFNLEESPREPYIEERQSKQ